MNVTKGCGCGTIVFVLAVLLLIGQFTGGGSDKSKSKAPLSPTPTIAYNPDAVIAARDYFSDYAGVDWYSSVNGYRVENQRLIIETGIYLDSEGHDLIERVCKVANGYIEFSHPAGINHYEVDDQDGDAVCSG